MRGWCEWPQVGGPRGLDFFSPLGERWVGSPLTPLSHSVPTGVHASETHGSKGDSSRREKVTSLLATMSLRSSVDGDNCNEAEAV
jgi:hypothetical protein